METIIEAAKKIIDKHSSEHHKVGAVLRATDGTLFKSISVQGQKLHLCSEWSAITQALMAGVDIDMAVAVCRKSEDEYIIYPPCGICRELFATYFPDATIIVSKTESVKASDLLPYIWKK